MNMAEQDTTQQDTDKPENPAVSQFASQVRVRSRPDGVQDESPLLGCRDFSVYYSAFEAIKKVTVEVPRGEVTSIIGPSGCGKSTLLNAINRTTDLIPGCHTKGTMTLDGEDIYDSEMDVVWLRRRVGMVFQKPNPFPKSVYANIAYLSIRRHDIRDLQYELHTMGLSSLGRMETYVLPTLEGVLTASHRLVDRSPTSFVKRTAPSDFEKGRARLAQNTEALYGPIPDGRNVRIMITMPSEAAERPDLVRDLVTAGMNVMRINCSKDGPERWQRMIEHLRRAERDTNRRCRVQMDLAGPNPRTGPLERKPPVLHWRPYLDITGRLSRPAVLWLTAGNAEPKAADEILPLKADLLGTARSGDKLRVLDTRGHWQVLHVRTVEENGCWADAEEEAFVEQGTTVQLHRDGKTIAQGRVGQLPRDAVEQEYYVNLGDRLVLTPADVSGHPPRKDNDGNPVEPACIGCTMPEVFRDVRKGDRFFYDDGELGGMVREVGANRVTVEITHARKGSAKIKSEKGVNFPDTDFDLPALTDKDFHDLDFIVRHADVIGMSFVRCVRNVEDLIRAVSLRKGGSLGIVPKIETRPAFDNLPELLLTALQHPPIGVMGARGDMGVELGFTRMSEVQEEILWLCEAAHIPVVWATQVLESLAKKGLPTRAEVTDAAMSGRAEFVMLNKGEHIVATVEFLCDVLQRMQQHQSKKISTLRKLSISEVGRLQERWS